MPDRAPSPKRDAILAAALEVFAERGVRGVAVPEIAARASVGTGTIYRYFASKDVLVNELFREHKRALGARLDAAFRRPSDPPQQQFAQFWAALVAFVREDPAAYRFLELQDHLSYLDDESRRVERELLEPMGAGVSRLQRSGSLRDDLRHEVVMAMIWGAFVNLFKAERQGYLVLTDDDLAAARDGCWRMIAL
ncbi:TetR/AcrR family transcriptional regulator [Mumia sp. Pv 4-285]|uniref:TetR/AcrR family transcriptional regulator n=1 Tax=Mumia qirimensis TaxID=3234852 RepID=UPI00351CE80D